MVETTALARLGSPASPPGCVERAEEFLATRKFTSFQPTMDRGDAKHSHARMAARGARDYLLGARLG